MPPVPPSAPAVGLAPDLRAVVAAAALALLSGHKVAGLFDHAAGRHRRLAAEHRDGRLQGLDGDRGVRFGGQLPELAEAAGASFTLARADGAAQGYDRRSATAYHVVATDGTVQVFDHGANRWFAYTAQLVPAGG